MNGALANAEPGPHVLAPAPNGVVDDMRIYARVPTVAEIITLA